jgi:hypothetical protein
MTTRWLLPLLLLGMPACTAFESFGGGGALPSIAARTRGMRALPGLFPLYWDERAGRMWLEIPRFGEDFLYVDSLPAGLGSNDIGLDRGQLGRERVVHFERSGPKVLLVASNLAFRTDGDAAQRRAVAESFAQSVLGGFEAAAASADRVLVDATAFFLRDAHDVTGALRNAGQGSYALDSARSAFYLTNTRNFPRNTEVEVTLTFTSGEPGARVRDVAPDPTALTVRTRHSLVQLPGPGYTPRAFDPRAGYGASGYFDCTAPLGESPVRQFLTRHRLVKRDPAAAHSAPVEPIVYYVDPATPEPMRSALLEGASWWNQAFTAAGFVDAFRVELLPADADPMDVRYNVIQWVYRDTRGWSYGGSVVDPRTGEIIKGHVTLGALRVRQDYLIAEGLLAPYREGREAAPELQQMALARLRQLAAHEVGHTLGLAHNFLASTHDRASVMDYPYPLVRLRADGSIDTTDAYARGIGEWDQVAITYGYAQFPLGTDEPAALQQILSDARGRGLTFLTDQDARPPGSAHPQVHLWDNGSNAVDELQRLLPVRQAALARFGEDVIRTGQPLATMEEALVPLYLMHRYQIEAAAKSIGGTAYTYALRGDGQEPVRPVAAAEQRRAIAALLAALAPEVLALPPGLLQRLPPRPAGVASTRELFADHTGGTFDALAPAETAAELTWAVLFDAGRAARLVQQHASDAEQPGLDELLQQVLAATWQAPAGEDLAGEVRRAVDDVLLTHLLGLAADATADEQVRAVVTQALVELRDGLSRAASAATGRAQQAHLAFGARQITQFLDHPAEYKPPAVPVLPPGQPIGAMAGCDF